MPFYDWKSFLCFACLQGGLVHAHLHTQHGPRGPFYVHSSSEWDIVHGRLLCSSLCLAGSFSFCGPQVVVSLASQASPLGPWNEASCCLEAESKSGFVLLRRRFHWSRVQHRYQLLSPRCSPWLCSEISCCHVQLLEVALVRCFVSIVIDLIQKKKSSALCSFFNLFVSKLSWLVFHGHMLGSLHLALFFVIRWMKNTRKSDHHLKKSQLMEGPSEGNAP